MRLRDILNPWGALREARRTAINLLAELKRQELRRKEMLKLLDDVDSLVRFCSVHMPDPERYEIGASAMWSVAYYLAGDDEISNVLASDVDRLKRAPKRDAKGRFAA